jgi:hypothetical protein
VPVVLREDKPRWAYTADFSEIGTSTSEQTFKFIGECYVHGQMDGEAKEMKSLEEEDFSLE